MAEKRQQLAEPLMVQKLDESVDDALIREQNQDLVSLGALSFSLFYSYVFVPLFLTFPWPLSSEALLGRSIDLFNGFLSRPFVSLFRLSFLRSY